MDNQPNYIRFAPACNNCIYILQNYNPGCQTTDCYCNIDKSKPKPIDDCGICDNYDNGKKDNK